ncbi:unnamed protein product [Arabidopsis halleri]
MLSDLPFDLVDEILSRVPTKFLIRLRSTCKRWNSLFDDHRFSKKHLGNAIKQSMFILFSDLKFFTISCELQKLDCYNVSRCKISLKECICKGECKVFELLHCDGLLLGLTNCFELIVWNPCLKQTKLIEPHFHKLHTPAPGYAFGCDKKYGDRRYKILLFLVSGYSRKFCKKYLEVEIYDFTSNSWRVLNVKIDFLLVFPTRWVSLEGNSYWIGADENTHEGFIVRFDFSNEMFGRLSLPFLAYPCDEHLSLSVKNDRISILHQTSHSYSIEIWMTGSVIDGQEVSWSRLMRVDDENFDIRFINPNFFIHDEENRVVIFCDKKEGNYHRVCHKYTEVYVEEVEDYNRGPIIYNYVPSLVHIR